MEHLDLAGIMRDCMLSLVGTFVEDEWECAFVNDELTLALLPRLAAACKDWHDAVFSLTRYPVICVAFLDF